MWCGHGQPRRWLMVPTERAAGLGGRARRQGAAAALLCMPLASAGTACGQGPTRALPSAPCPPAALRLHPPLACLQEEEEERRQAEEEARKKEEAERKWVPAALLLPAILLSCVEQSSLTEPHMLRAHSLLAGAGARALHAPPRAGQDRAFEGCAAWGFKLLPPPLAAAGSARRLSGGSS